MLIFKSLLSILSILFLLNSNLSAQISIKYKVGDEIITNADIEFEKNYLIFLRPNLVELSNKELEEIAKKSTIRETIKKKEINKVFKDLDNIEIINGVKKSLFRYKNVKNENEFLKLIINKNLDYEKIVEKMKLEGMWNELIYQKYNNLVKIDKEKLKFELKDMISKNKQYEYNLSELLFEIEKKSDLEKKYNEIVDYIKSNNFNSAASLYSVANSSAKGGEIGWIKETLLSRNLNSLLSNMNINDITKPIKYPNGYLILRINGKKEIKQQINIDNELDEMIRYETNKQLNQFSLLYYKKLKQNILINEY